MQSYTIHPICRNCYEDFLRQGGGLDRHHNGVYGSRLYAGGLPLQVDAQSVPCSVCEEPFMGPAYPNYDQMFLYMMTEDQFDMYFADVVGAAREA